VPSSHVAGGSRRARMRWATALVVVAAAGAAVLATSLVGDGSRREPSIVVDRNGIGGRCDDGRKLDAARSSQTPLCSIPAALAIAPPGMTIEVRAGSYPALHVDGKTWTKPVTVAARRGDAVRIPSIRLANGTSHIRFSGLRLTGDPAAPAFQIMDGHSTDVTLERSNIESTRQDAVELRWGTSHVTIQRNRIHTAGRGSGVVFANVSDLPGSPFKEAREPISDVVIRGNHFDGIAIDAIRPANFDRLLVEGNEINGIVENGEHCDAFQSVFGGRHLVFRGNYIHDNAGQGLFIKDGRVTDAVVENNVFVHNKLEIQVQLFDVVGLRMVNNTIWDNQLNMILRRDVKDAVVRNNLIQDMQVDDAAVARREIRQDHNVIESGWSWGPQPGDVKGTPRFVDAAKRDYRLAAGSPGVNAGARGAAPARDKACRRREGVPDAGALERRGDSKPGDTAAHPVCDA
jgi:hypothetical protein